MRTAVAGVFAAGDFVAYQGKVKMIAARPRPRVPLPPLQ